MASESEKLISNPVYETAMTAAQAARPVYAGTYEGQLNDLFDQISNRGPFQYNVNADPLYQSYKDQYIQGGKLAMKDTMGQAAALTGGYGSTYGQQVGQQAYDAYLQNLSAVIPELYGLAKDAYDDEGDKLRDLYGMVGQQRDTEYGLYRDALGDWNYNQDVARGLEQEEYRRRVTEDETAYNRQRLEDETAWNRKQADYANLYAAVMASGYIPTDEELAAAGITREQADAWRLEYMRQVSMQNEQLKLQKEQLKIQKQAAAARSTTYVQQPPQDPVAKYSLADAEAKIRQAKHSNQVQDLVRAVMQDIKNGMTNFTLQEFQALLTANHW